MDKILVTGFSGNTGNEVAKRLLTLGQPIKAAVRNIEKAAKQFGSEYEFVKFDFESPETYPEAFRDVNKIFLIRPPQMSDAKQLKPVLNYAKEAGVSHLVFLSLLGVEKNIFVPHHKIEKFIKESGIPYTFLRASFFMQNLNTVYRESILKNNEIYLPAGKGKTSFIDVRDIAEVAVRSFIEEGHQNKAYSLTGSEALDYYEVADIFTEVLGRKITYPNPTSRCYTKKMQGLGLEEDFIKVMSKIYLTVRLGFAAKVTTDTERILKRPPIKLREYIRDYKDCWL